MNCSTLRHTLLAAADPESPLDGEARHVAACPACRAWQEQLTRLERRLPLLVVPDCPVPASLLDQIRTPALRMVGGSQHPSHRRDLQGSRQKLALAFSLAASLAIFTVGWWAWPQMQSDRAIATATDSYPKQRDAKLAHATTPAQRATALADLADDFLAEVRQKPNDPARLVVLAAHFDRLVHEDLMQHVRQVSPGERRLLASALARRLNRVESEASRLAAEWQSLHANAIASLHRIAASAREGDRRLRLFG